MYNMYYDIYYKLCFVNKLLKHIVCLVCLCGIGITILDIFGVKIISSEGGHQDCEDYIKEDQHLEECEIMDCSSKDFSYYDMGL
jgi:hypothetical protein